MLARRTAERESWREGTLDSKTNVCVREREKDEVEEGWKVEGMQDAGNMQLS